MESLFDSIIFDRIKLFIKEAKNVLLISHLDADGLSSAGIIARLLKGFEKNFTVRIIKQLENDDILRQASEDLVIITDMGSGQFEMLKSFLDKRFIIIDHHQEQNVFLHENIIHFNPCLHDDSYSASSLSFLAAKTISPKMSSLVHLGLVGAVGDMQYKKGFTGLNKELLEEGIGKGMLSIVKGLNIFGRVSKPVHEALAYSFEVLIPGVSGNESGAIEFLSEINVELKNNDGSWKTLASLSESENKKLISGIIMRRLAHKMDSNIISEIININNMKGVLSDLKEWSVLLNACGRQGAYSLGVSLCMGYEEYALPLINNVLVEYRRLIVEALNLVKSDSSILNVKNDLMLINAGDKIKDTIIGTIGGMLLKSNDYNAKTFLGFARRDDNNLKVSCRTTTENNVGIILKSVCENLGCSGGGHKLAGGALVPINKQEEFIKQFKEELEKHL